MRDIFQSPLNVLDFLLLRLVYIFFVLTWVDLDDSRKKVNTHPLLWYVRNGVGEEVVENMGVLSLFFYAGMNQKNYITFFQQH